MILRILFFMGILFSSLSWGQNFQKGAEYFLQYCSGCHSLDYTSSNFWVNTVKPLPEWKSHIVNGKWHTSLHKQDAIRWLGQQPPDLSLIAHQRGRAWIVDYLNGFYDDQHQLYGRNNRIFKNVAMPDVLYNAGLKRTQIANDIADFLMVVSEPNRSVRIYLGLFVMLLCGMAFLILRHVKKQMGV